MKFSKKDFFHKCEKCAFFFGGFVHIYKETLNGKHHLQSENFIAG